MDLAYLLEGPARINECFGLNYLCQLLNDPGANVEVD